VARASAAIGRFGRGGLLRPPLPADALVGQDVDVGSVVLVVLDVVDDVLEVVGSVDDVLEVVVGSVVVVVLEVVVGRVVVVVLVVVDVEVVVLVVVEVVVTGGGQPVTQNTLCLTSAPWEPSALIVSLTWKPWLGCGSIPVKSSV
jgi:hypothetical protein